MMEPSAPASPRRTARIAGALYLAVIAAGVVTLVTRSTVVGGGDAAATAARFLASESVYRLSVAADLVAAVCYIGVAAFLYELLKPVSRTISLLAAFFALTGCATGASAASVLLAPAILLKGAPYLAVFSPDQLQALALMFIRLNAQGSTVAFIFFGCYCLSLGYLVSRSAFLPRGVGAGLGLAGLGWLTNSVASLLALPFAGTLSPFMAAIAVLGETALTLWLLARGVDAGRWVVQAAAQDGSSRRPGKVGPAGAG